MIADLINNLGPWSWVVGGVLLILLELLAPGVFLVWLGLAAVMTGLLDFGLGLSWQFASLLFCVLSVALVVLGRFLSKRGDPKEDDAGLLNHRAYQLVGNIYVLEEPIVNGEGRVRVGDSIWLATGPDLPGGARVKVIGSDGPRLKVQAA